MKRSALKRTASLSRGSGLARRAHKRSTPVTAPVSTMSQAALEALERRLAQMFHDGAQRPRCPCCHSATVFPLHAHHCIEAHVLDRELRAFVSPERLIGIRYDLRNCLGACSVCHLDSHYSMRHPIQRKHLPACAWEFAREIDALVGTQVFTVRLESYKDAVA